MITKNLCTGCGACEAACPQKAITLQPDKEGFLYPVINPSDCNQCALCEKICPAQKDFSPVNKNTYFGSHAKEKSIRLMGSSGGMFPLFALHMIQNSGAVFGAHLSENGIVSHIDINKPDGIKKISKTKYVQSSLSGVYNKIQLYLKQDHKVLFCGTPCQIEGIRSFLGKDYENLFLIDLICYGVPSPGIWKRYIRFLEKKYNGRFQKFSFRDKRNKDNGHTVMIQFRDKKYAYPLGRDMFLRTYFRNINVRPSCFQCRYCTVSRNSDITIGDFWGIEKVKPEFEDGMGNSLIICHTEKGKMLWNHVKEQTEWFSCKKSEILQPRLKEPTPCSPIRGLYMKLYRLLPFSFWIRFVSK